MDLDKYDACPDAMVQTGSLLADTSFCFILIFTSFISGGLFVILIFYYYFLSITMLCYTLDSYCVVDVGRFGF